MKYIQVGGVRLSAIGVGTWQFGSTEWGYGAEYNRVEAGKIVRRALDLGVNLIDTAEFYGFGRSERIVGQAIRGRRDEVFLATKIFPIGLPLMTSWRARGSARRLGVDVIDLYQLHWPSPLFPPRSTMPRMRSPLGQGLLSGKYQDAMPSNLLRRRRSSFSAANRARLAPLIAALREIGDRHGATPAQVSLAWLIRKPNVVAIPGASSLHQLEENVAAGDIELSDEESARLDSLSA